MLVLDADTEKGGLTLNKKVFCDLGEEPNGKQFVWSASERVSEQRV